MKPSNIFSSHENYKKFNSSKGEKKSVKKQTLGSELGKLQFANREDKSLSLGVILKREFDYQFELRQREADNYQDLELHFDQGEKESQVPEDYNYFI